MRHQHVFTHSICFFFQYPIATGDSIGDDGAAVLGESLQTNTTLTELDLSGKHQMTKNRTYLLLQST